MNSLVQRFDTSGALSEIKRAQAIIEEDGDNVSELMWGSYGGFGNLATGFPKFNIPAVPDVSISHCAL
jgi:20S proteasome subunit beta 5